MKHLSKQYVAILIFIFLVILMGILIFWLGDVPSLIKLLDDI